MRYDRLEKLISKEKLNILKSKTIAVFGLGGVGSYAFEAIVRSGVSKVIICDFDIVDITNINRQLIAYESTLGSLKTDVASKRAKDINPYVEIIKYSIKADKDSIKDILDLKPDFVVDAIDDVLAKTELITQATNKSIKIVSSMGFANKFHPEMIEIAKLSKTTVCPLAKTMRKRLKEAGVTLDFPVVYSTEKPTKSKDNILGSTAYTPSVAGLIIASYVINQIVGV